MFEVFFFINIHRKEQCSFETAHSSVLFGLKKNRLRFQRNLLHLPNGRFSALSAQTKSYISLLTHTEYLQMYSCKHKHALRKAHRWSSKSNRFLSFIIAKKKVLKNNNNNNKRKKTKTLRTEGLESETVKTIFL